MIFFVRVVQGVSVGVSYNREGRSTVREVKEVKRYRLTPYR